MARRPAQGPTEAELEILSVLWKNGPCTVRDVFEHLNKIRRTGYTTALKLLQIMSEKGLVKRDESRRSHVYTAAMVREQVQRRILSSLLERLFDDSVPLLVTHALKARHVSASELEEVARAIDQHRIASKS